MTERTKEILSTMQKQACKTLSAAQRNHSTSWYEVARAKGVLSVIRVLEQEGEQTDDSDERRNS